jgi:hypothetical protein
MTAKLSSHIPVIFCMGFACMGFAASLFGQIDSNQLRARYGAPLARETFTVSPNFQIIADYGPDQVWFTQAEHRSKSRITKTSPSASLKTPTVLGGEQA